MNRILALAALAVAGTTAAFGQIRVVNYNVAQLNGVTSALEDVFAAIADDDKPGFAAAPHLLIFQEVQTADLSSLASRIAAGIPGVSYTQATFTSTSVPNEDGLGGAQALYYRTDSFTEDIFSHIDLSTGGSRQTDRWRLKLTGYDSPPVYVYVYSSHLKAGSLTSDRTERATGAATIRTNADALGAGVNIIYAGDWNLSDNAEQAYLNFIAAGNGQAIDPLGNNSWAGAGNAIKHTQSPQDGGPLTGGGMDDRFDFQLSTSALNDGEGLAVIAGTYRSLGNDGQHFDRAINNGPNVYYPVDPTRSDALADALFDASDHVPVIVEYQVPAVMNATLPTSFGRVIQNTVTSLNLAVTNTASALVAAGADELDFSATGAGVLTGSSSGTATALGPTINRAFTVLTSTVGPAVGALTVTATSPEAQNSFVVLSTTGTIVRAANASFSPFQNLDTLTVRRIMTADSGLSTYEVDLHNFAYDSNQALLDVDFVGGPAAPFAYVGGATTGIGSTPATLEFTVDTAGLAPQVHSGLATALVSDEDIPGATVGVLLLTLEAEVREILSDVDGNCVVDLSDLGAMLSAFGSSGGDANFDPAVDLDNNGMIDLSDLGTLLSEYGTACP